eukprot:gnl/TRDRNA2_/TRDRNA2_120677_c0_seq2.p1 gnl/TRDRNA2_/TRDRNA2_120677_c0~~gnl/TRDRNA2_/TRDRNA2_120677_c0_seq2.p1  ORF type:complete len:210 (-),score=35.46 gnl/TRDRNA2_/TRDRNA2_120677_c0_seq2:130-759(-)
MGCGCSSSKASKPQSATTICQEPGCEWTKPFSAQIEITVEIVGQWCKGGKGAEAQTAFTEKVFGVDANSAMAQIAREACREDVATGGLLGGLLGALGFSGAGAAQRVQEIYDYVAKIFDAPTKRDSRQLALYRLVQEQLRDELLVDPTTGQMMIRTQGKLRFTGDDLDQAFRDKVREMCAGLNSGLATQRTIFLELGLLCLCIEVCRQT